MKKLCLCDQRFVHDYNVQEDDSMRDTQRLDKILSNMGYGSRTEIKKLVKSGVVRVDGKTALNSAMHVDPHQQVVTIDGQGITYKEFVYLIMNKPQGVVSATEDFRDRTVVDLIGAEYGHYQVFPVGRLDKDTEGLLLLTNDGKAAHRLLSPRKQVPKTYYAIVQGTVGEKDMAAFSVGVTLDDGYTTLPAQLKVIEADAMRSKIELTIVEGKFHQVKRMFEAVDKRVIYLQRKAMGPLTLPDNLALGRYRELNEQEFALLKPWIEE